MSDYKFCCDEFKEKATSEPSFVGGGFLYPPGMQPGAQFEICEGEWHVKGCCGGGCYVVSPMRFCPFCDSKLELPK